MLVDEDGQEIARPGEPGEFWIRSPNMLKGYWRNLQATKDTITPDGWLKTGDIAYVDETGKWYMIDRKKVGAPRCHPCREVREVANHADRS